MKRREVLLALDARGAVLFAEAGDDPHRLPDARARWERIWEARAELYELSHSHPEGPEGFSAEDETTMEALEAALGRTLRFSVVGPAATTVREAGRTFRQEPEPPWATLLRLASGMDGR